MMRQIFLPLLIITLLTIWRSPNGFAGQSVSQSFQLSVTLPAALELPGSSDFTVPGTAPEKSSDTHDYFPQENVVIRDFQKILLRTVTKK